MKLVKIGALAIALGLSSLASAKVTIGIGSGGGIGICIGKHCGDRGDSGGGWDRGDGGWDRRGPVTVCYAQNARGFQFAAQGRGPAYSIQNEAVAQCRWSRNTLNPRTCRPTGCRTSRW